MTYKYRHIKRLSTHTRDSGFVVGIFFFPLLEDAITQSDEERQDKKYYFLDDSPEVTISCTI